MLKKRLNGVLNQNIGLIIQRFLRLSYLEMFGFSLTALGLGGSQTRLLYDFRGCLIPVLL